MDCFAVRNSFESFNDNTLSGRARDELQRHLRTCESCSSEFYETLQFYDLLSEIRSARVSIVDCQREEGVAILRVSGDLDDNGVDSFRTALYHCRKNGYIKFVVDVTEVRFISYMGVGVLAERLFALKGLGGDLRLVGLNLYTERLLRMVGLSELIGGFEDEEDATEDWLGEDESNSAGFNSA